MKIVANHPENTKSVLLTMKYSSSDTNQRIFLLSIIRSTIYTTQHWHWGFEYAQTPIWNGSEVNEWTPIYKLRIFKKLDPTKHKQLRKLKAKHTKRNKTVSQLQKLSQSDYVKAIYDQMPKKSQIFYCFSISEVCLDLFKWLVISRAFIFCCAFFMIYFLSIAPFDASSDLINNRILSSFADDNSWTAIMDRLCLKYLSAFGNWDGLHFLQIAQFGYEHEKIYAFYPGLPLIMNSLI